MEEAVLQIQRSQGHDKFLFGLPPISKSPKENIVMKPEVSAYSAMKEERLLDYMET